MAVLGKRREVLRDARRERRRRVAVVMEMELDLAEAEARELAEAIEKVRTVLFPRKEPALARRPAVAVAKLVEPRVRLRPRVEARAADFFGSTAPQRLVVIAQREQQVTRSTRVWRARTAHEVACVIGQPLVEVLLAQSGQHVHWMLERVWRHGCLRSVASEGAISGL